MIELHLDSTTNSKLTNTLTEISPNREAESSRCSSAWSTVRNAGSVRIPVKVDGFSNSGLAARRGSADVRLFSVEKRFSASFTPSF